MPIQATVCVCIAAYNAEATVARAVQSALAVPEAVEVIVVDDASNDATAERARTADDGTGRLRVVSSTSNGGPAAARNRALELSRATLFCILDSDDYFAPGRLGNLLASTGQDWDMLADNILIVPEHLDDQNTLRTGAEATGLRLDLDLATFVRGNLSRPGRPRGELGFLKPLVRRAFIDRHGLRYDPRLRLGEDYAFYLAALVAGARFGVVDICGYIAIERPQSLSSIHDTDDLQRLVDFDDRQLAAQGRLAGDARVALTEHRKATANKLQLRRAIDCKRQYNRAAALAMLLREPRSIGYVLGQTVRAKSSSLIGRWSGGSRSSKIRQLINPGDFKRISLQPSPIPNDYSPASADWPVA